MKVRRGLEHDESVELNMTSMIDIVFQLLVFFIMTFKIVVQEGDFNIRMPAQASGGPPSEEFVEPLKITLEAFETDDEQFDGMIRSIQVTEGASSKNPPPQHESWNPPALRDYIENYYFEDRDESSAEAILVLDPKLKYLEVIKVVTAISGTKDPDTGQVIRLFEKISFERPPDLG